ncbi:MAG: hypothetical protein ACP5O8_02065 [Candidatus Aenigmatarchaeota archaeon]
MKGSVNKYIITFIILLIIGLFLLIFFYAGVEKLIKEFLEGISGD